MTNIFPFVMNTSFERLGVIDDYISLIWSTRYYSCGDFELCLSINNKSISMIKKGYYIMREDDDQVGIVEDIKLQRREDLKEMMIVSGRFLSSIVGRRIIEKQTQVSGTPQACIQKLMNENAINPSTSARKLPNLSFSSSVSQTQRMQAQYTGKNLLETIENICLEYGIGFKTILTDDYKFVFQLYEGVDHSYNQSVNPYVIFSDEYDNLLSSEYEENYLNVATDVLVAGEGEGLDRKTIWAYDQVNSGLNRYEIYQDARNVRTNEGEISDEVYYEQLRQDGLESITKFTQAFNGTVYFGSIEYKKDINIGDICVIENKRWGLGINARLVEVIESVAESGEYSIVPTFAL